MGKKGLLKAYFQIYHVGNIKLTLQEKDLILIFFKYLSFDNLYDNVLIHYSINYFRDELRFLGDVATSTFAELSYGIMHRKMDEKIFEFKGFDEGYYNF